MYLIKKNNAIANKFSKISTKKRKKERINK